MNYIICLTLILQLIVSCKTFSSLYKEQEYQIESRSYYPVYQTNYTYDVAKEILPIKLLIIALYSCITLIGVTGNLLVVWIVLRVKPLQTITNLFIANLAISDILMSIVATPFTPLSLYMNNWTLPEIVCKLLPTTMGVSVYVSTLTSMAIALDRYFVIVHPFLPRMKIWLCFIIIFIVWIIAILISMPLAVYQQKHYDPITNISNCRENWPKESSREVFTIVSFILQFIIPCSIITICYFRISLLLQSRLHTQIGSGIKTHLKEEREIKRKRRTNTMLIAMVIIFVICWIPLNILWMIMDIHSDKNINDIQNSQNFTLIFFICHLLAMSSAVYNPFLYAWMNNNFRKEFHHIIPCFFLKRKYPHHYHHQITTQTIGGGEYTGIRINYLNSTIQPSIIVRKSDEYKDIHQNILNNETMTIDQPQDNNNNNNDIFITKFVPKSGEQEIEQSIEGKIQEIVCHVQVDEKLYTTDNYSDYQITDKPNNNNNNNNNSIDNKQYSQTSFDKTSIET